MSLDFEVLLDDLFENIASKDFGEAEKPVVCNKKVLSLINDFEDGKWRAKKFHNFILDNIKETALSKKERDCLVDKESSMLEAAAQNLRLTDKAGDIGKGSELAEIVLYGIMKHYYKALAVVPKIFYKQNSQDNAKGADSVHIVLDEQGDFTLWFGEAKFYTSIEDARLAEIVTSVGNSLGTEKLRKENAIITNLSDIENLDIPDEVKNKIKDSLSQEKSIDQLKPKINIPILLLHECAITREAKELTPEYRQKIIAYHKARAIAYFNKQIKSLAKNVFKYADIKFHIILFPVPQKSPIVNKFVANVAHYKGV